MVRRWGREAWGKCSWDRHGAMKVWMGQRDGRMFAHFWVVVVVVNVSAAANLKPDPKARASHYGCAPCSMRWRRGWHMLLSTQWREVGSVLAAGQGTVEAGRHPRHSDFHIPPGVLCRQNKPLRPEPSQGLPENPASGQAGSGLWAGQPPKAKRQGHEWGVIAQIGVDRCIANVRNAARRSVCLARQQPI